MEKIAKIFRKDIRGLNEFEKGPRTFRFIKENKETGWRLYDLGNCYEVVKLKKRKNPDGEIVYVYPCDEDFGTFGYCISKSSWYTDIMIDFYMSAKTRTPQEVYDFKMGLKKCSI